MKRFIICEALEERKENTIEHGERLCLTALAILFSTVMQMSSTGLHNTGRGGQSREIKIIIRNALFLLLLHMKPAAKSVLQIQWLYFKSKCSDLMRNVQFV